MKHLLLIAALALAIAPACSKQSEPSSSSGAAAGTSSVPESFWSAEEPAGALPVAEVHAQAKSGDHVVLVGRVGGDAEVFFPGAGVFTVVDPSMRACSDEGDPMQGTCETPWDYCCVDRTKLLSATATVELRQDGKAIKVSPQGFHGLDHLATVVVAGTAERDEMGNLVVAADSVHVRR